jgi:hypothetical protein
MLVSMKYQLEFLYQLKIYNLHFCIRPFWKINELCLNQVNFQVFKLFQYMQF